MKRNQFQEQQDASHCILAYLLDNPDAGDTFEGIVEWWLLSQRIKFEARVVSEAVAKLVADNLLVEQKRSGSRVFYKINRTAENIEHIRTMLNQNKSIVE